MTSSLIFSEIAELRNEKVNPESVSGSRYIGLEHIEQNSLSLSGWGIAEDVDSQKQRFYEGDILFGKLRPYFRKVAIAPFDGICSTDIWVVRPVVKTDRDFLFYWMASEDFIARATNAAEGTRMPRAKWDWVSRFELPFMSPINRQRTGAILRSLDDKIAHNRELSQTMEEIAQTLFRSWFVDFDPVKAKMAGEKPVGMDDATAGLFPDTMQDSELGAIPDGWSVSSFNEIASISKATVNPQKFPDVLFRHYSIPDFDRNRRPSMVTGVEILSNKFQLASSAVLLSKLNPETKRIWTVVNPAEGSVCSTEFIVLVPQSPSYLGFLHSIVREPVFYERFASLATGSTGSRQRVRPEEVLSIECSLPKSNLISKYSSIVQPLIEKSDGLRKEIETLQKVRDSMLPRLVSGELRIPEDVLVS